MSRTLEGYVFPIINLLGVPMTARVYDYKKPNVSAVEFNGNVDDLTKALPDVRVLTEQNAHSLSTTRSGFLVMKPGDFVVREAGTGFPSWSLLSAEDFANNFKPVATLPVKSCMASPSPTPPRTCRASVLPCSGMKSIPQLSTSSS